MYFTSYQFGQTRHSVWNRDSSVASCSPRDKTEERGHTNTQYISKYQDLYPQYRETLRHKYTTTTLTHTFPTPQATDHATKPHTAHLIKKDRTPYNDDPLSRRALIQTNINLI